MHTPLDDPRRAATLTLLARWQLGLGNWPAAERLLIEAERTWRASAAWLGRLRPGETPEQQAECRHLLQRATLFTATLLEQRDCGERPLATSPLMITGLLADRRKLEAAVATATANLQPETVASRAFS
jgi:hypothetical protein